jgi:alpha-tubulin suppressor-like RCC1 family protein
MIKAGGTSRTFRRALLQLPVGFVILAIALLVAGVAFAAFAGPNLLRKAKASSPGSVGTSLTVSKTPRKTSTLRSTPIVTSPMSTSVKTTGSVALPSASTSETPSGGVISGGVSMAIGNPVALMSINEGAAASSIRAVSVDSTVTDAIQTSFSPTFTQIDGGAYFTCGLASDGSLWTWGMPLYDGYGGTLVSSPQRIGSDSDWKWVSVGDLLAAGIKNDGSLWTWSYWTGPTPVKKTTSDGYNWGLTWNTVSVGANHLVAISTSGAIYTSGDGYQGQIGDGSMTVRTNATSPDSLYGTWTSVAAGQYHTAAVNSAGALYTWGANNYGQLGDGTTSTKTRPTLIGTGYKAVWCGDGFTVAQKTDGTLVTTGVNFDYQLGTNTYGSSSFFTPVSGASTLWTNVAVGRAHVIASRSDGTMWAWGAPSLGQHGDGVIGYSLVPEQVGTATNWTGAFAAGDTSYLKRGAEILSTGKGTTGFLGDGTVLDRSTPGSMSVWETYVQHRAMTLPAIDGTHTVTASYRDSVGSVVTLSDSIVLDVTAPTISFAINSGDAVTNSRTVTLLMTYWAPANHAVAIRVDGGPWVAPTTYVAATLSAGDGAKTVKVDAIDVAGNIGTFSANITLDATPPSGTMSISDGAPVTRFRNVAITSNVTGAAYVRVPTAWKSASAGTDHFMIIKPDGALWGWGGNTSGELGDGTTTPRLMPTPIGSALWESVSAAPY